MYPVHDCLIAKVLWGGKEKEYICEIWRVFVPDLYKFNVMLLTVHWRYN
jgi:hypothetical protein